jgi:2-haloacid dehalogenase
MVARNRAGRLVPHLISFDVFGTLVDVRGGTYAAFQTILADCGGPHIDVADLWEHWEERNIAHYWEPYRPYRDICTLSLRETLAHFRLPPRADLIERYFQSFARLALFPDVAATLATLAKRYRLAIVSNISEELLAATPLAGGFALVCTAERAMGYKPDGTLFRNLIARAGCPREDILHCGQSQLTDLVGGKPLGLTIAWINRRAVKRHPDVPPPDYEVGDIASLISLVAS